MRPTSFASTFALGLSVSGLLALGGCQLIVDPDEEPAPTDGNPGGDGTQGDGTPGDGTPGDGDGAPDGDDGDGGSAASCAVILCEEGTVCVETDDGGRCVPQEENPCNLIDCVPDHVCELQDGEPVCVPVVTGCDAVECAPGQHCEELYPPCAPPVDDEIPPACEPQPTCVDDVTCALIDCAEGYYCDDVSGTAGCIPLPSCDDYDCDDGQVCVLEEVVCVREPCPPLPTCIDDPCAYVRCPRGMHCEVEEEPCLIGPCEPSGQCVRD